MKTDREIVAEVNALAHKMLSLIYDFETIDNNFKFYRENLKNPRLRKAWERAVEIYEEITKSETADAIAFVLEEGEEEPPPDSELVAKLKVLSTTTLQSHTEGSPRALRRDAVLEAIAQVQELERIRREVQAFDLALDSATKASGVPRNGEDYAALLKIIIG